MALSVATLQAKRDLLVSAIAAGILEISSDDGSIRYQNIGEMKTALSVLDNEISTASLAAGATARPRQIRIGTSKGL